MRDSPARQPWPPRTKTAVDVAVLCALKLAGGAWVIHQGFSHVSDDDYARTVIAEQFAHSPRLDPSGTSWLPFPFWIAGAAMLVAGRSLAVARAVAVALGATSVVAPYLAMRAVGVRRVAAIAATAVAMALPWNAWLGVATVPESWAGALVAASIIAMADGRARPWCAGALLAASLSRYEAWPACAMLAAACSAHAPKKSHFAPALVALLGPVLWMAWNLHAHGNALHFIARVSAFRRAIGAADLPLHDKLLAYPRALVTDTPEAALLGLVGLGGLLASDALRARWRLAAAAALGVMAFLIAGDVRDGAPTHHAARALAPEWWVLVGMGIDTIFTFARSAVRPWPGTAVTWVTLAMGFVWCVSLPSRWRCGPGQSDSERRDAQIARGLDMRSRGVVAADITPCQFEHFALLAAWGWPERARVEPRTGESMGPDCPRVVER